MYSTASFYEQLYRLGQMPMCTSSSSSIFASSNLITFYWNAVSYHLHFKIVQIVTRIFTEVHVTGMYCFWWRYSIHLTISSSSNSISCTLHIHIDTSKSNSFSSCCFPSNYSEMYYCINTIWDNSKCNRTNVKVSFLTWGEECSDKIKLSLGFRRGRLVSIGFGWFFSKPAEAHRSW